MVTGMANRVGSQCGGVAHPHPPPKKTPTKVTKAPQKTKGKKPLHLDGGVNHICCSGDE